MPYLEKDTGCLFAYYQGAAGNMNTSSRISGETYKSGKIKEYGEEMGRQIMTNGVPKLQSAIVYTSGDIVVFCVSNNNSAMRSVIAGLV